MSPSPYEFDIDESSGTSIVKRANRSTAGPSKNSGLDFAIVGKFRNPWNVDGVKHVFLVAGIKGLGTRAAAEMMLNRTTELLKGISKNARHPNNFVSVIECEGEKDGSLTSIVIWDHILID